MTRKEMEAIEATEQDDRRALRVSEAMAYNDSKRTPIGPKVEFDSLYMNTTVGRICQGAL